MRSVVIGDLNENNIIVANGNPHIIDARLNSVRTL